MGAKIALARARPGQCDATTVENGASLGVPNTLRQPKNPSPGPLRTRVCAPGALFVKYCKINHDLYRTQGFKLATHTTTGSHDYKVGRATT